MEEVADGKGDLEADQPQGSVAALPPEQASAAKARFYRPELDALRLFAFLCVFVVHGPRFDNPVGWQAVYNHYAKAGEMGLCLFFFLSSYLITELLLRERERSGEIHLKRFYIRRLLRIWPLYYFGVALAVAWGWRYPEVRLNTGQVLELVFLVGWAGKVLAYNPFGVLWSISVEEMFYAVWPWLARRRVTVIVSLLLIPVSLAIAYFQADSDSWYNPAVHFLYFATGALVAAWLHGRTWTAPLAARGVLLAIGCAVWIAAYAPFIFSWLLRYLLGDIGCLALFLAVFQIPLWIPGPIRYFGKISYGLYVFHNACLYLTNGLLNKYFVLQSDVLRLLLMDALSLMLAGALAAVSYHFFESPFLKLKSKFEVIHSRAV